MRHLLAIPAAPALGACAATGSFVKPSEMTAEDRCFSARVIVAGLEANEVVPASLKRAKDNAAFICGLVPVGAPLARPAE